MYIYVYIYTVPLNELPVCAGRDAPLSLDGEVDR